MLRNEQAPIWQSGIWFTSELTLTELISAQVYGVGDVTCHAKINK